MNRREFEAEFEAADGAFRQCSIVHALANGPDWKTWAASDPQVPNFYNDLAFLACYSVLKNNLSMRKTLQLRDFLVKRQRNDAGFLVDPVHAGSSARKTAAQNAGSYIATYRGRMDTDGPKWVPKAGSTDADADQISVNIYHQVYSEMWLNDGSMRAYLALGWDKQTVQRALIRNTTIIQTDREGRLFWLNSLANRFAGTSHSATMFGATFDPTQLGLRLPEWNAGRTPVSIGTRRTSA